MYLNCVSIICLGTQVVLVSKNEFKTSLIFKTIYIITIVTY